MTTVAPLASLRSLAATPRISVPGVLTSRLSLTAILGGDPAQLSAGLLNLVRACTLAVLLRVRARAPRRRCADLEWILSHDPEYIIDPQLLGRVNEQTN